MTHCVTARPFPALMAIACAFGTCTLATSATAQSNGWSATARVEVFAEVIQPLRLETVSPLSFGGLSGGTQAGSITVAPNGQLSVAGGAFARPDLPSAPAAAAASFTITGEAGRAYRVSTPNTLTIEGQSTSVGVVAATLVARNFTVRTLNTPSGNSTGQLDSSGRDGFSLGATLDVPAQTNPAIYVVIVPVSVDYT